MKYKRKIVLSNVIFFLLLIIAYILCAVLPYNKCKGVSELYKNSFDINDFYSENDSNDKVMMLDDSKQSFKVRMDILSKANDKIYVSSYATHSGNTTSIFFGGLIKKAQEGIEVNIILDGKYAGLDGNVKSSLINEENINLYYYNPLNVLKPGDINDCLHDKYFIVDNNYMIFGGRNIGDKYYADENYTKSLSLDREILVYNSTGEIGVINDVKNYYYDMIDLNKVKKQEKTNKKAKRESEILIEKYNKYIENNSFNIDYNLNTYKTNKISLVTNGTKGRIKESVIAYSLLELAKQSKKVLVQSPYTILNEEHLNKVKEITDKGVNITLLTNSLASTPNAPAYSNFYVNKKKYLDANIEIYEYQSNKNSLHAKTFVFDDDITVIGSFNLDERSINIDTEAILIIDSKDFNRVTKETINNYINQSLLVNKNNKYNYNENVLYAKPSFFKKGLYWIIGKLFKPINYLL